MVRSKGMGFGDALGTLGAFFKRLHTSGTRLKIFAEKWPKSWGSGPGRAFWVQHPFGADRPQNSLKMLITVLTHQMFFTRLSFSFPTHRAPKPAAHLVGQNLKNALRKRIFCRSFSRCPAFCNQANVMLQYLESFPAKSFLPGFAWIFQASLQRIGILSLKKS